MGIARTAFPVNASDALWEKFKLGEVWKINDPETGKPAVRNIYQDPKKQSGADSAFAGRARRGVLAVQHRARRHRESISKEERCAAREDRAELVAGLNPGVHVVPAHSMATGLAQERGFTYMKG